MNAKDRPYNQRCWEMGRRDPDWRMRSGSRDGEDNITSLERGSQGPGGMVEVGVSHSDAKVPCGGDHAEGASKPVSRGVYAGIELKLLDVQGRPAAELPSAWCLKPYWGKPDVRNFREGGWKRG